MTKKSYPMSPNNPWWQEYLRAKREANNISGLGSKDCGVIIFAIGFILGWICGIK